MEDFTTIQLKGLEVELYNSITDFPIMNYQEYNAGLLVDANIGSGMEDVTRHISGIYGLIDKDPEAAKSELEKLNQCFFLIVSRSNPKMDSFVARIKALNGQTVTDYSEANRRRIAKRLSDAQFTAGLLDRALEWLKKKLLWSSTRSSPV